MEPSEHEGSLCESTFESMANSTDGTGGSGGAALARREGDMGVPREAKRRSMRWWLV